jgi:hypothetical protein|eukprot:COSAG01_NODE_7193_length_3309_cov_49.141745_4_plen_410_part_00
MRHHHLLPVALLLLLTPTLLLRTAAFDVVWSGRWTVHGDPKGWNASVPCCRGLTGFNLSSFPVLQQGRLALFFPDLGLYRDSCAPVGLPQTVDLDAHAAKVAVDVAVIVPADKDMFCCIDWETYTPLLFDHGEGSYEPPSCPEAWGHGAHGCGCLETPQARYSMPGASCAMASAVMNASMHLVLRRQPSLNSSAAAALAVTEFNAAARAMWTRTLMAARRTRPRCRWGFYAKPMTENLFEPFTSPFIKEVGDAYQWMFNASTALFPSTYMHFNQSGSPPPGLSYNRQFVQSVVAEAERVNNQRGTQLGRVPILPWVWYRYLGGDYSSTSSLMLPEDVHTALAEPGAAGADGVLVYEDGAAQPGMPMFAPTERYMQTVFGPVATALYGGAEKLNTLKIHGKHRREEKQKT